MLQTPQMFQDVVDMSAILLQNVRGTAWC